jgi:hypothetical protein
MNAATCPFYGNVGERLLEETILDFLIRLLLSNSNEAPAKTATITPDIVKT